MAYRGDTPVEEAAVNNGLVVVTPEDNELLIDLDTEEAYAQHLKILEVLDGRGIIYEHKVAPSKSGLPNRHVTLKLISGPSASYLPVPLDPWQRIALQAALGSDPVRELLSCMRVFRGITPPTAFLELPTEAMAPEGFSHNDQILLPEGRWI